MPDGYYDDFLAGYRTQRDFICPALEDLGLQVYAPQGAYYVMVDFRQLDLAGQGIDDSHAFCHFITRELGVAAIPSQRAFYTSEHEALGRYLVRFSFCKPMAMLEQAMERLQKLKTRT